MDFMIAHKSTGSSDCFAQKLNLSRSTFFEYLAYFRNRLGLDIEYNLYRETYFYKNDKTLCSVLKNKSCFYCEHKECQVKSAQESLQ